MMVRFPRSCKLPGGSNLSSRVSSRAATGGEQAV